MIDLTKPVYCGGEPISFMEDRNAYYPIIRATKPHNTDWWWSEYGTSMGDWPPLTNVPPETADREGEESLEHKILKEWLVEPDPKDTRIAELEKCVRDLVKELTEDNPWWDDSDAEMTDLLTRAKALLS